MLQRSTIFVVLLVASGLASGLVLRGDDGNAVDEDKWYPPLVPPPMPEENHHHGPTAHPSHRHPHPHGPGNRGSSSSSEEHGSSEEEEHRRPPPPPFPMVKEEGPNVGPLSHKKLPLAPPLPPRMKKPDEAKTLTKKEEEVAMLEEEATSSEEEHPRGREDFEDYDVVELEEDVVEDKKGEKKGLTPGLGSFLGLGHSPLPQERTEEKEARKEPMAAPAQLSPVDPATGKMLEAPAGAGESFHLPFVYPQIGAEAYRDYADLIHFGRRLLSKAELRHSQLKWAAKNGIQKEFEADLVAMEQEHDQSHQVALANLAGEALDMYKGLMRIENNGRLTQKEECDQFGELLGQIPEDILRLVPLDEGYFSYAECMRPRVPILPPPGAAIDEKEKQHLMLLELFISPGQSPGQPGEECDCGCGGHGDDGGHSEGFGGAAAGGGGCPMGLIGTDQPQQAVF